MSAQHETLKFSATAVTAVIPALSYSTMLTSYNACNDISLTYHPIYLFHNDIESNYKDGDR